MGQTDRLTDGHRAVYNGCIDLAAPVSCIEMKPTCVTG